MGPETGMPNVAVFDLKINNSTGRVFAFTFGRGAFILAFDSNIAVDFDGDGKSDIGIYRDGTWIIIQSNNNAIRVDPLGGPTWTPVPADYDGDGKADIAVYNANGTWSIIQSSTNTIRVVAHGGGPTDVPLHEAQSLAARMTNAADAQSLPPVFFNFVLDNH